MACAYIIFSVVSYYSFGHDNDLLENELKASTQRNNISRLLLGVKINQHFPFDLLDMIPFPIAKHIMPLGALDMVAFQGVRPSLSVLSPGHSDDL